MPDPDTWERDHILGLDLGQSSDPSALTVTEKRVPVWQGIGEVKRGKARYAVVWIDRYELGTPYPEVVRSVKDVKEAPQTGREPPLVLDATGLGGPVVDQFHEEGVYPVEITFTSGREATRDKRQGNPDAFGVPKKDLATLVQSLLQSRRLEIAEELDGAGQLVTEMKSFRVKMTDSGHARFEHAQESDSDDVLLSLACALWYAERSDDVGAPLDAGHVIR